MHVPDGFLNAPTSAATGVIAAGAVALAVRGARRELDDRTAPMAGLVATFIFAGQMVNFAVGAGTSGHLLGGALAAALVGPWTGVLCVSVVLLVQSFLFADGGVTALGTNICLIGLVGVGVGWLVMVAVRSVLPKRRESVVVAAAVGAAVSVPTAAAAFSLLLSIGGNVDLPISTVLTAMVGWHVVIGLGEALITAVVIAAVMTARPDLVHAARGYLGNTRLLITEKAP
ncbi:MAG: energy-coupling factor ABC transporter permease [Nocardioides sp.]